MKTSKISIIVIAILSIFNFHAQTYSSTLEEEIFNSYKRDSLNYNFLESLFAIDSTMNLETVAKYKQELLSVIKTFPVKEDKAKKEKRRIKAIYDEIHSQFFRKYALDSYFTDIFNDGTYNCVTASALYAFTFDELNIPYHIKETPSHVFLIAYPNTHKIYLETTVPGAYGFTIPKESEVKKIIDELIAYKLVTTEEVLDKGYMKFYEDYYYGKEFVDKRALIGMQYYNKGLTKMNDADYDNALNNLRKSKVFYSSPLINPILKGIMFIKVNGLEFNTEEDIDFLIELLSISKYPEDYTISNVKSSLFKIIEHDDNNTDFIERTILKLKPIENEKIKNEAVEFLYEYLARNAANDEELDIALHYCDEILLINPKSKIAEQIIEYACFRKVMLSLYDLNALKSFMEMSEKYAFLKSNKRYNISLAHFYGNIALRNFQNKDIDTGTGYMKKFESVIDDNDLLDDINKILIADLYLKAGNYYYYKDKYQSSYRIFTKGLSYIPNHPDLIKKAQWSKEEL
jgi:tetratricopeptide (TPR) repeat protein